MQARSQAGVPLPCSFQGARHAAHAVVAFFPARPAGQPCSSLCLPGTAYMPLGTAMLGMQCSTCSTSPAGAHQLVDCSDRGGCRSASGGLGQGAACRVISKRRTWDACANMANVVTASPGRYSSRAVHCSACCESCSGGWGSARSLLPLYQMRIPTPPWQGMLMSAASGAEHVPQSCPPPPQCCGRACCRDATDPQVKDLLLQLPSAAAGWADAGSVRSRRSCQQRWCLSDGAASRWSSGPRPVPYAAFASPQEA